jgi:hypothetical protein
VIATSTPPEPDDSPSSGRTKQILIAALIALALVIGVRLVVRRWIRGGGPRRAITGLAEDGAVKLTDAVIDEILGAA